MMTGSESTASSADETTPGGPLALLAIFAQPDDEAFRAGGTLALLARRGVQVHTATRGEADGLTRRAFVV